VNEFNRRVIEEFRAGSGVVRGPFAGMPLLLLTTTGARSGRRHTTPLAYLADGGRLVVFGSKGGAPSNPDWYHTLRKHPTATVELGDETFEVKATIATGEEHERLFATQAALRPQFAGYQAGTTRVIPVIVLERTDEGSTTFT
jgi:deazaflavin-dependent oxidoreductase (nitroreductase family)